MKSSDLRTTRPLDVKNFLIPMGETAIGLWEKKNLSERIGNKKVLRWLSRPKNRGKRWRRIKKK
ncbi:hypothetical protein LEP1GSC125_2363 [Leptospira mayottensis 200901122]|uniref:Uncharacterized protein n=2 Tax=Leptospira mayottensis TaxID=1137606 RepID=A0AA87MN38_9LEPT|nr:hypothetical protein DQM28_11590 [Leptospira mayottensis]EKR98889.1 hypothetical protein LEP1GSC125_2363 [Leptospira mayottensis 200901122]